MADQSEQKSVTWRIVIFVLICYTLALYTATEEGGRTYWPYMLSAYLLGIFVYRTETRSLPPEKRPGLWHYFFPGEIWGHPSAVNDYIICFINWFIIYIFFSLDAFNPYNVGGWIKDAGNYLFPAPGATQAPAPGVGIIALYTFVSFLMGDLFYYISHRLTHRIPALWEFHKIHHSAEVMTPFTLYRMHPIDVWLNVSISAIGIALTTIVFAHFYPGLTRGMIVMGAGVGFFLAHILGANLRHSHIWLSFGPLVEHIFLSPAQHQIHHSTDPRHFDKNYSSLFAIWDWMFGSLYITHGKENITFGLGTAGDQKRYESVWDMYFYPFVSLFKRKKQD